MKSVFFFIALSTQLLFAEQMKWQAVPTTLSISTETDSSNSQIGIDRSGNCVALWLENGVVYARNYTDGSWHSATALSTARASDPQLVVDVNGNATALWIENGVLKASAQPFMGAWDQASNLINSGTSMPSMAVDTVGNVVAVWISDGFVQSATKLWGSTWSIPDVLSSAISDYPQVAVGAEGTVVAAWYQKDCSVDTIHAAIKFTHGGWMAEEAISTRGIDSIYPEVAVDPSGNILVIWFRYTLNSSSYTNVVLQSCFKPSRGSWGVPVDISAEGMSNPYNLNAYVQFDGHGNAVATWNQSTDGARFNIQSSMKRVGKNWSTFVDVEGANIYTHYFSMDVDERGDALLGCMMLESPHTIRVCTAKSYIPSQIGNMWAPNIYLSDPLLNSGFPEIGVANNGTTLHGAVVWIANNGSHNIVQASVGLGTALLSPTRLTVTQAESNMGLFIDYYNILTWEPGSSSKCEGYFVYRNGELIAPTDPKTLQLIDHNRQPNESVTYGVSTYEYLDHFEESAPATIIVD